MDDHPDCNERRVVRNLGKRAQRVLSGGWGREGVRSEARAELRLAPGGRAALPL